MDFASRSILYQGSLMINICDLDLVGKKIQENEICIELNEKFFLEEKLSEHEVEDLLFKCSIANLVGKNIVSKAISLKLAKEQSIKTIAGVPFLMIYKFYQSR